MRLIPRNLSPKSASLIARGELAWETAIRLIEEFHAMAQERERFHPAAGDVRPPPGSAPERGPVMTGKSKERQEDLSVVIQLKEAILASGPTHRDIAKAADIGPDQISRFMAGKRDLTLATASRVCDALGLELVPKKKSRKPKEPTE